ncbi:T9SS type A sorting domain-containing protein [candidate division TA06 bacterium]|nr:T9SS type A sorting domain-containing protein [candidate division TA06 bacterium]
MKRWLSLFLFGTLLSISFTFKESLGFRKEPLPYHWADSEPKGGWVLRDEPDAGLLSPGAQWDTLLEDVPTNIAYHAAVAVEVSGAWKVYLFGGFDGTDFLATTYEYDVTTDSWSTKDFMPGGPRGRLAAAVVNGKVYVFGGTDNFYNALDRCEVYDPVTNTWTPKASMPTPRQFLSAAVWRDTLIYVMGGDGGMESPTSLNTIEVYDPLTNIWMTASSLLKPRRSHASGIIGDKIFVAMGWSGEYLQTTEMGLIEGTLPTQIFWEGVQDAPYAASRVAGATFLGKFYVTGGDSMGGDSTGIFTKKTYRYDPDLSNWETVPDKPTAVANSQAFVGIDEETLLVYPGGWTKSGASNGHEGFPLAIHDAEAETIIFPQDTVCIDSTITPKAIVGNSGIVTETFDVELLIFYTNGGDTVYIDSQTVPSLEPESTVVLFFDNWIVSVDTPYTAVLTTKLANDENSANDTYSKEVERRVRDVASLSIVEPPVFTCLDSTYTPKVIVENLGCSQESFDVVFSIYEGDTSGSLVYSDTASVSSFPPGDDTLTFSTPWTVPADTSYTIIVYTQFSSDARPDNDTLSTGIQTQLRDVAPLSIIEPPDSLCVDFTYTPEVAVENFGCLQESFDVVFSIYEDTLASPIYSDSVSVASLSPGDSSITFSKKWTPSDTSYIMVVYTQFLLDTDSTNDRISEAVVPMLRDVMPLSIEQPPDSISVDSTYIPEVVVQNLGCLIERFDVVLSIYYGDSMGSLVYSDTFSGPSLPPGIKVSAFFKHWTVPLADTSYFMIACTQLSQDADSTNDCVSDSVVSFQGIGEGRESELLYSKFKIWNSPNPSHHSTIIHFTLPSSGWVSLRVYDLSGRSVRSLLEEALKPGDHKVSWDGMDDVGRRVSSGIYFSRLQVGGDRFVRKIVLIQ